MTTITITISDTQYKGLSYAAVDPQFWINNLVEVRANTAVDEIVAICVQKCLENEMQIPSTKEGIVALAFTQEWVKTAEQQSVENSNLTRP
jgi:hypothetical protein